MPLFISSKERVERQTSSDVATAFRQIERYTQRLETYLGVAMNTNPGTQTVVDVPVGGLVGKITTPSSTTTATNTNVNLSPTAQFPVVNGHTYMLYAYSMATVTVGSPAFVNVNVTGSPIALGATFVLTVSTPGGAGTVVSGQIVVPIVATSTTTEVITVNITDSGAGTTFSASANSVLVELVRVA